MLLDLGIAESLDRRDKVVNAIPDDPDPLDRLLMNAPNNDSK